VRPAHVLELPEFVFALGSQAGSLRPAHLVHGLVHVLGDMEAIQHMQRLSRFGGKNVEIGLPHIAADEAQPLDHRRPKRLQALPECLLRASLADPQQPPATGVDLIDQGQEVVCLHLMAPVNLVHTDRLDAVAPSG
jgi:hypothetical protein